MLAGRRLILSRKRFITNYSIPFTVGLMGSVALFFSSNLLFDSTIPFSPAVLILLAIPATAIALFLNQYTALRLKQIDTGLSKENNYKFAKIALENLQWEINVDTKGYIETFNPLGDITTWEDQMISIIIDDNVILINSICNVDSIVLNQSAFSLGKNRQNVRRFLEQFELASSNYVSIHSN